MNIKSLLFGSAAALAVVSGAQAADAVVAAEPEPMEYVRVCDAYGTGYFYIPGTETCLKISGQFRYQKEWAKAGDAAASYGHWSRGRIELTAKNDSEWGTVSSWIRIQGSHSDNRGRIITAMVPNPDFDPDLPADDVTNPRQIEGQIDTGVNMGVFYTFGIGGLEFGYHDSQFAQFFGYGGRTDWGGDYINWGYGVRQYISYTASFDSITAIVSVEHDRNRNFDPTSTDGPDSKYMPDVVVGLKSTFGDWTVMGGGAYDESDESFALIKKITGDIGMFGVTLVGLYSNSSTNSYFSHDGFSVIAGASADVTESVSLAADFQYWDNENFLAIGDVNWKVATGFSVLLEGAYFHDELAPDVKSAMLRFQRSF